VQFLLVTRHLVQCFPLTNPWIIHESIAETSCLSRCRSTDPSRAASRFSFPVGLTLVSHAKTGKLRALETVTSGKTRSSSSLDKGDCPTLVSRVRGMISRLKRIPQVSFYGRHDVDVGGRITLSLFRSFLHIFVLSFPFFSSARW